MKAAKSNIDEPLDQFRFDVAHELMIIEKSYSNKSKSLFRKLARK